MTPPETMNFVGEKCDLLTWYIFMKP